MDRYDQTCNCVHIPISGSEERFFDKDGFLSEWHRRRMVNDGRDLLPDADCSICHGTGIINPSMKEQKDGDAK